MSLVCGAEKSYERRWIPAFAGMTMSGRATSVGARPWAALVQCGTFAWRPAAPHSPPPHVPLRRHDLHQRVPVVPSPAGDGKADPAVVRRLGGRVDDLPRVLPDDAPRRLCVLGLGDPSADATSSGQGCTLCCCWSRSSCCRSFPARAGNPPAPRIRCG